MNDFIKAKDRKYEEVLDPKILHWNISFKGNKQTEIITKESDFRKMKKFTNTKQKFFNIAEAERSMSRRRDRSMQRRGIRNINNLSVGAS